LPDRQSLPYLQPAAPGKVLGKPARRRHPDRRRGGLQIAAAARSSQIEFRAPEDFTQPEPAAPRAGLGRPYHRHKRHTFVTFRGRQTSRNACGMAAGKKLIAEIQALFCARPMIGVSHALHPRASCGK
jgi:hypothetical protein